ncbi:transcription activator protein acu-15 [Fusarium bulbicola]|nr:transcription activator protein acu-15 [Fusarium bulbicola]
MGPRLLSCHWIWTLGNTQSHRRLLAPTRLSALNPFEGNGIDEGDTSAPQADVGMGMDVMFGAGLSQAVSIEQVLNTHLPSRKSTDRLVSAYFRVRLYITPCIHSVQFQRQYEAFWSDPAAASPLWISTLFSMLFISANISRTGKENEIPGHGFAVAAAQCLALGEYFRPKAFCFEALLLYLHSRFITCLEIHPDMGALLSVLAHIATVSGNHRESSVPSLSPFTAEMRRRAWSMFMQLNLLVSFHLGVPSRITLAVSDTRAPSNLLDSDFDEDSTRLPTSRPDSELTNVTFCILKHRFMTIFDKILQHALVNPSHEAIDARIDSLDTELKHLYRSLPELYRPWPIENSYEECKPGGQLETEEWFMKSITWHDFLLGVTTLCLVAYAANQITGGFHIDQLGVQLLWSKGSIQGSLNSGSYDLSFKGTTKQ